MKKKKNKLLPYIIAIAVIAIIVLIVGKKQGWLGKDFEIKVATEVVKKPHYYRSDYCQLEKYNPRPK